MFTRTFLGAVLAVFFTVSVSAQQTLTTNVTTDPMEAVFSYSDMENFIEAYDLIVAGGDRADILQRVYLERATPGLKMFISKYDLTVERLMDAMERFPEAYQRLPVILKEIKEHERYYRKLYAQMADIIPDSVFPPTYFVVAGYRGIGSGSTEGPLISIEKKKPGTIKEMYGTLVHEMTHIQQLAVLGPDYFKIFSGPGRTLLATTIREGGATYMAEIIADGSPHKNRARDWLLEREEEMWLEFKPRMHTGVFGDWLFAEPKREGQPNDVGYALGARIVEHYYVNAKDKKEAARNIMEIRDYKAFLEMSGYADKFK